LGWLDCHPSQHTYPDQGKPQKSQLKAPWYAMLSARTSNEFEIVREISLRRESREEPNNRKLKEGLLNQMKE
jgi:hypothetical protein